MKQKIKKICLFIMSNWFKIAILIFLVVFLYVVALYVNLQVRKYNRALLKEALSVCDSHRVEQYWQNCIDNYMNFYIGSSPKFKYPH